MKISSTKLRHAGLYILIGILIGAAIGLGLSMYYNEERQPVLLHYADNYSGELSGVIDDKKSTPLLMKMVINILFPKTHMIM